jgi:hypothetical protein
MGRPAIGPGPGLLEFIGQGIEGGVLATPGDEMATDGQGRLPAQGHRRGGVTAEVHRASKFQAAHESAVGIAYVDDFLRTPSNKIAKNKLVEAAVDLRAEAYDQRDAV